MNQLNELLAEKKWDEIILIGENSIKNNSDNLDTFVKLAISYRHTGQLINARKILKKGLNLEPQNSNILIEIAALENETENWVAAVQTWEKVKNLTQSFSELNYQRYAKALIYSNEEGIFSDSADLKIQLDVKVKNDKQLKKHLIRSLKTRLTNIRNTERNKPLALLYAKNIKKIINSHELDKELAISYMHSHQWQEAIHEFEAILLNYPKYFDAYDFNRLLKSYEMQDHYETYEDVVLEGIRIYPNDKNLPYRLLYFSLINNISNQEFEIALQKITLLLGSNKPEFWNLDKGKLLQFRNTCLEHTAIKNINADICGLSVVSNRADGLGERLNSLLNAIVISKTFGYRLGYTWRDISHALPYQKGTENKSNLIGHAIVEEQDFFSPSFIKKHSVTNKPLNNFKTIIDKNITYASLSTTETNEKLAGWFSPRLALTDHFSNELLIDSIYSYRDAFSFIDFNKPIAESIQYAKEVMQESSYIAIHLRSGDVFYGEYRKFLHYTYKGIVLPLAKKIIEDHKKKGLKVIVFGQDLTVLSYLKEQYNIITVEDFSHYSNFDSTQQAMFEITLMSRAKDIIAGSSGFAKLAGWIGEKNTKAPTDYYNAEKQTKIIINDLKNHADDYPKLQTSFAYWYGYFYGRQSKDLKDVDYLLSQAYKFDPENDLYPLVLASNYYKHENYEIAESIVKRLFNKHQIFEMSKHPTGQVLQAKTMGKPNMIEFFSSFNTPAQQGFPYATLLMLITSQEENKNLTKLFEIPKIKIDSWLTEYIKYHQ